MYKKIAIIGTDDLILKGVCAAIEEYFDNVFVEVWSTGIERCCRQDIADADLVIICADHLHVEPLAQIHSLALNASSPVVILTQWTELEAVAPLVRMGVSVVFRSRLAPRDIVAVIRLGMAGNVFVDRDLIEGLAKSSVTPAMAASSDALPLTPRETQILGMIAAGLTNPQIARELCIATSTVKSHVERILAKSGTSNRVHAAVVALREEWNSVSIGSKRPAHEPRMPGRREYG